MLIFQNRNNPGAVRNAIMDSLDESVNELRICSAYITMSGNNLYRDCCLRHLSDHAFSRINKYVITSLDFGITEPDAIRFWRALPNTEVRIAGVEILQNGNGNLSPQFAYHPKLYTFGLSDANSTVIVGSANLTGRGLTVNSEAVWQHRYIDSGALASAWQAACVGTVPARDDLIDAYEAKRAKTPRREIARELEPVPSHEFTRVQRRGFSLFPEEVTEGRLAPARYSCMWVEGGSMSSGGSHNQLELPRGASRFFGFHFGHYESKAVEHIGNPVLISGKRRWDHRPLTWHGDNMMERLNLPTLSQGGFSYRNMLIMFRKLAGGAFELTVAERDSDMGRAWVAASSELGNLFRVGKVTERLAGFLA